MSRGLKYDIPGTDWRVPLEQLRESGIEKIFAPELAPPLELVVDIGFGRGEFLRDQATRDPARACLGVEYSRKRVLKLARRLARTELANVRLVEARAEEVVDLLPEAGVAQAWINFPDPWPKARHHRRRLIQPPFVHALALRLAPGGTLHVATDHVEYAEWIAEILPGEPLLENRYAPDPFRPSVDDDRIATGYELEWRAEGRALHFFSYRRRETD